MWDIKRDIFWWYYKGRLYKIKTETKGYMGFNGPSLINLPYNVSLFLQLVKIDPSWRKL